MQRQGGSLLLAAYCFLLLHGFFLLYGVPLLCRPALEPANCGLKTTNCVLKSTFLSLTFDVCLFVLATRKAGSTAPAWQVVGSISSTKIKQQKQTHKQANP